MTRGWKTRLPGVTINTDASFCPHEKVGGWAFHIVTDDFVIKKAGIFEGVLTDPTHAESICIYKAIDYLNKNSNGNCFRFLVINTDSLNSIRYSEISGGKIYKLIRKSLKLFKDSNTCKRVEFRHVKAHSGVEDARSLVNEWCDREAKNKMREARKKAIIRKQKEAKIK